MRQTLPFGGHHAYDRLVAPAIQACYMEWARRHGANGRALDIGCGPGHLAAGYARLHDAPVTGVDLDPVQLQIARSHHRDLRLVQAAAQALPFRDGSHDVLWTSESFHHWSDPEGALAEAHRVLRPGGTLWIIEGCGDISAAELSHWMPRWLLPLARGVFWRHGYTPRRLVREVLPLLAASPFSWRIHRHWGWWWIECKKV